MSLRRFQSLVTLLAFCASLLLSAAASASASGAPAAVTGRDCGMTSIQPAHSSQMKDSRPQQNHVMHHGMGMMDVSVGGASSSDLPVSTDCDLAMTAGHSGCDMSAKSCADHCFSASGLVAVLPLLLAEYRGVPPNEQVFRLISTEASPPYQPPRLG